MSLKKCEPRAVSYAGGGALHTSMVQLSGRRVSVDLAEEAIYEGQDFTHSLS